MLCDCGNEVTVTVVELFRTPRPTRSCGCLTGGNHGTHGLYGYPLYQAWRAMMRRCYDPKCSSYPHYGGRGITVCPWWHDIRNLVYWIDRNLGSRPPGATLERKRNGLGYKPSNVRWASWDEQASNRRPRRSYPPRNASGQFVAHG